WRQDGDHGAGDRPGRRGRRDRVHLLRARRGGAPQRPDHRAQGPPQARGPPRRRVRHHRLAHRHHRRRDRARRTRRSPPRRNRSRLMTTDRTPRHSAVRELIRRPYFWGLIAIALLLLVNSLKDPGYLAVSYNETTGSLVGNLIDILRAAAPIAMISVGMCLVIATAGIDLSVRSLMAVSGAVGLEFLSPAGSSPGAAPGATGLALLLGAALGTVTAVLVPAVGLQPFISTLVLMLAGRGLAKVITGGQNTAASNGTFRWI